MRLLLCALLLAALVMASISEAGGFKKVRVVEYRGAPQLLVDGRPVVPLSFMGWYGSSAKRVRIGRQWERVHVTFISPEDADGPAGFQIRFLKGGAGKVWIDDLKYYEGEPGKPLGPNMQPHGDFEDTGDALPPNWGLFFRKDKGAEASWAYDETSPASGKRCLRIDLGKIVPGGWTHVYLSGGKVEEGHTYTVELSLRADPPREIELAALHQGSPWTSYMSGDDCVYIQQVRLAARAGVHIHQFGTRVPWPRSGEAPSYVGMDKAFAATLRKDPQALIMLRFGVEPPAWWLEQHPDECTTYEDGTKTQVSVCSQLWLDELMPRLEAFVRHIEEKWGDRLLVYFPSGQHTGEWFYPGVWTRHFPGFSPALARAFRAWVKRKYDSPQKLSEAWGRQVNSFDEVEVPSVAERTTGGLGEFFDPSRDRFQIDFFDFMNDAMASAVQRIAATIKRASGGRKPVMFFHGYLYSLAPAPAGLNHSGHLRIGKLLRDPNMDIFCSPIDYFDRQPGGAGHFMAPVESIAAHGKLWFNEDDTRTYLTPETSGYGRCATLAESQGVHQRNFAQIFPRRMGCWYMDLGNAGWLDGPHLWGNIAKLRRFWQQHIEDTVSFAPQVAVITDARSPLYVRSRSRVLAALMSHERAQIARLGAPVGYWLLEDFLAGRVKPARLYIFQNAFVLTARQRERITQILREQKATAVWFYAPGFIDPEGRRASEDFMRDLTGFALQRLAKSVKDFARPVEGPQLTEGVAEHLGSQQEHLRTQWAVAPSPGVEVLARYAESPNLAAAAVKDYEGFRSVYIAALYAPAALLRNLARQAGVWVFCDSDDVVLGDVRPGGEGRFLALAASSDGEKILHLPRPARVVDCLTGVLLAEGTTAKLAMKKGQTSLLWLADVR